MRSQLVTIFILLFSTLFSTTGWSQSGSTAPPPPQRTPPPELPIDNGLFVLLVLGLCYGAYYLACKTSVAKLKE